MTTTGHAAGATLTEGRIGAMPWLRVAGERQACFHALGAHAAGTIRTVMASLPQLDTLRRQVHEPEGRSGFEAVVAATADRFPVQMEEMAALAAGAGVPVDTVLLLDMRGDLGDPWAEDCSDVTVPGEAWLLGHNEDGDALFAEGISGLSLLVDGDVPVFALWYPGMLPSNAFTLNEGLTWGIDHVPPEAAMVGPSRHVVARALQQITDLDEAVDFLASEPSAGGFAYNFAERSTGRVATVEAGGGAGVRVRAIGPDDTAGSASASSPDGNTRAFAPGRPPVLWHTNHLRLPSAGGAPPRASSCARGDVLAAATTPAAAAPIDRARLLEILTTPLPTGVRSLGDSMTLCTVVVDGAANELVLVPPGGELAGVPLDELLA